MRHLWALLILTSCWGSNAYIVEGVVVEVSGPTSVVLDHEAIEGLGMSAMVMDFQVSDAGLLKGVVPGDRVYARMAIEQRGAMLHKLRVTGHGPPPVTATGPTPVRPGALLPRTEVTLADGRSLVLGAGQEGPVALTFLYTTCPMPEFCPAIVMRMQALQDQLPERARIVAVTIDPDGDTPEVLKAYGEAVGAGDRWLFARAGEALAGLAMRAALRVVESDQEIQHSIRLLVLDADGLLVERYDDNNWPLERVVQQLATGGPPAPPGTSGTITSE
jgi:protein SCO1/2